MASGEVPLLQLLTRLIADTALLPGELPRYSAPFGTAMINFESVVSNKAPVMKTQGIAAIGSALLVALLAGCDTPKVGTGPKVPDNLRIPAMQRLSLKTRATGVQIYDCKPGKDDPARFEWVFRAPEAKLIDAAGRRIGKHYAGPTWESNDGSQVVGEVKARDDAPDVNAIPWLLMSAKSTSGAGVLGQTVAIQRVQTVGGKAPVDGCSEAQAGKEARVPYSATYYFYVAGP